MARPNDRINSALSKHGYSQIRKVGEGSFGAAILVQHTSDKDKDSKAIVKMIDISRASRQEKDDALKESQVLSSLKHPYIVRYRESFHEEAWLCIVMDYCEGGDLSDRIKKYRQQNRSFSQDQVVRWFTQAVLALKYIHDQHILHRDLKSGNFFLSKSDNIKLGDFGIAKVLECTAACAQTQIGTPYYLSPEICQGKPYAWSSDIWAMGCILYEMCARRVPFDAQDLKGLIQRITKGPSPEIPAEYSSGLRHLCKELLDRDPGKRPPAADILKKPVVQEMVRRMLDEVKEDNTPGPPKTSHADRASGVESAPVSNGAGNARRNAREANGVGGKYGAHAGCYVRNDQVEYYSETHGEWLPATITGVDADGKVMLNVKPNVWITLDVQGSRIRPKGAGDVGSAGAGRRNVSEDPLARAGRGSEPVSPGMKRPPQSCPSPGAAVKGSPARPPAAYERNSAGANVRQPSREGRYGQGQRGASPRRELPSIAGPRAPSQDRVGAPPRRSTPQRQRSSDGRG